jgi:SAM-dependent methyltransferase
MFYKLKIFILKFLLGIYKRFVCRWGSFIKLKSGDDIRAELIRRYAIGKSFADIGCMWRVNGYFSFLAEECGAKQVVGVDVYPESEEFLNQKSKRNSKVKFIQGDINSSETINKIGLCDVVFCSGVLYHTPNPVYFLSQLRAICKDILILGTMVIPEMVGLRNIAVFYPFLNKTQRKIYNLGVEQRGITDPYNPESGYANWFWGFSPSCVESMLKCTGFEIKKRYLRPFQAFFVCKVVPVNFY